MRQRTQCSCGGCGREPTLERGARIFVAMKNSGETFDSWTMHAPTRGSSRTATCLASDLLPLLDFICLFLAGMLSTFVGARWLTPGLAPGAANEFEHAASVAAVLAPFTLYAKHFGLAASRSTIRALLRSHALRFSLFAGVVLALGAAAQTLDSVPRSWLAVWFVASVLTTLLTRTFVATVVRRLQRRGAMNEVIAVVGAGPVADRLVHALQQSRPQTVELLGIFDDRFARAEHSAIKPIGNLEQLIELHKTRKIDLILLTLPPTAEHRLSAIVQRLVALSVPIGLCPQHVGSIVPHRVVHYAGDGLPISLLADRPIKRWDAVVKSAEDFLFGGIITLLLLPLLGAVAVAIKLDSPGPVIFKQRRHTLENREFDIYKFRTMRWNPAVAAEKLKQTARRDERITRVGRFLRSSSLDELPQLFNVLQGHMSLVGPRPHAVDMRTEDQLGAEIAERYEHRHRVKPGMTGWSQVNGARGATTTTAQLRRRVELDLRYIDDWSLLLDLKILALTFREVLRRTNAY